MPEGDKPAFARPLVTLAAGIVMIVVYAEFMSDAAGGGGANIGGGLFLLIGYIVTGVGLVLSVSALMRRRK
ncbi:hypothetical protein SAMN05660662_3378 [Blastococcus aurantiacus]|uniref:Uncharacterized protein n=1 Tax=Blastococcus aurantiacus TaxID=1550231 RepID=A0A1G7NUB1_9ACTN|nr:hypothetical protein [Blastococcus aurantiacus]SDF77688.1 hypothetical protein SAMN05660662_3378 [Blastococcus aurantiacus]